ncbi:MAG: helix-hairpin-helix domain-containing protein, partial [Treponema sp.]
VGVNLNTASYSLLKYVSGITSATAKKIVAFRDGNGKITNREDLKKVSGLGPKAYEQCAGFLKIPESSEPLDNTWVHPENYGVAREILPLIQNKEKITAEFKKQLCEKYAIGETTLGDIIDELQKPNRDPRDGYPAPIMQQGVLQFEDLKEGMKVTGKIKNVVDFGAFVDIGLHETGLIHVSELSDTFVKDPMDIIKVGDVKEFTILALDKDRRRISLSLKSDAMSRLGSAGGKGTKTEGDEKRRVVIVRKDAKAAAGRQNAGQRKENAPAGGRRGGARSSGSDDGMTYNPFAALLKK